MSRIPVMIIDDEYTDRYLLKRILKKSSKVGEIFEAENGQEALDFLTAYDDNLKKFPNEFPPLFIFLDINMHIMNGFEFLEQFAKLRNVEDIYKICVFTMFTSSERLEDKEKADQYDFVKGFISKGTFSVASLEKLINEHLSHISTKHKV